MASAQKRPRRDENETIDGYIHMISPVKTSKNKNIKYFNAEKLKFTDVVCFKPDLHCNFQDLEKNKSPVSLKNIQRVPSNRTSADFDIRVGFASELSTPVRALDFDFQPPPTLQTTTIKDIEQNLNAFQKATIAIKVIDIGPTESRTTRSGQVMDCKHIIVADSTSSISCCLWEAHFDSIKLAQSYKITNVAVRNFDNIKTLTTCPDTAFEATNDIGPIVESEKKPISVEKIIRIKSAACTAANKCSVCSKDVGNFNSELDTIKCQSCNMRQRTLDITKQYKCEVVAQVDNNNTKLIIPDLVLRGRPDLVLDPNQLETQLLNSVSLTVKLNIGCTHVLDITHIQN
ncbi:uncharacterized protein LOC128171451 [Crassostrea angulata]|uniref:uncharacterized protein LOC128171451 n=1 Tax=Magallana angulata TaxID=2784310 RepID=UPI0022B1E320|nr:uncharacterized protein LOC128171451 [Crassostrea angulata]